MGKAALITIIICVGILLLIGAGIRFMLHIYAALAEKERRMISARTKAAFRAAEARGVVLGMPSRRKPTQRCRRFRRKPAPNRRAVHSTIVAPHRQGVE